MKRPKKLDARPWECGRTAGRTERGQNLPFIRIFADLPRDPVFNRLTPCARLCFIYMGIESGGKNAFQFTRATAAAYGISNATLRRCITELEKNGFIRCVANGKSTRTASDYIFLQDWKLHTPP